jgi:glycosyltransferase involved in cell wall biosynthesis
MDVDLVIPTYNRAHLLKDCLNSVFLATRPKDLNINVVVVDNNSGDNTREVVQPFLEQRELSIRYIFVGRSGKSAALNEAIAQTDAELVGLIDDDEQLDAAWFEVACREFSGTATLDYIGGPCDPHWEHAPPDWLPPAYTGAIGIVPRPERVAFSREFNGMLMGGNAVIRRSALERVLPYPEELGKIGSKIRSGEDEVIYHRLLDIGARGMVVPDLIIRHWIPAERLTKRYFRKWAIGRGISIGSQLRERGFEEPGLLGIPRYKFGDVFRGFGLMLAAGSRQERFTAQLSILDCFATLYGRHFY